eukprot:gene12438-biopygen6348
MGLYGGAHSPVARQGSGNKLRRRDVPPSPASGAAGQHLAPLCWGWYNKACVNNNGGGKLCGMTFGPLEFIPGRPLHCRRIWIVGREQLM